MRRLFFLMLATMAAGRSLAEPYGMTLADFQAAGRARLMQADRDHDGRISRAEWAAPPWAAASPKRHPGKVFDRLDTDRDGALDRAELDTLLARRFARMEANRDGVLTAEERGAIRGRPED